VSVSPEPAISGVQSVMVGLIGIATVEQMNTHIGEHNPPGEKSPDGRH
jgi:hypothetical protein